MDLLGGGSKSMQAGRLLAAVWLLCASFAMQIVAVGQGVSARASAGTQAGDASTRDSGSADHSIARQISRAVPHPDLRFTGERKDAKSTSGQDLSPALLVAQDRFFDLGSRKRGAISRLAHVHGPIAQGQRIRAPPTA
ncbi:hypothetical protein [Sinorhizobium psoraleae]|uniref:Uncharacterized protein n=1 Tax=Sinorhizobium psoraleae TaxID=520838 RepID=A0ABT4KEI9_9HYPH|nr:hypothetical protein [Sinorhizobium psoraleae]MCZ4090381.1 hypothetical protein [Sinorhizobium psoraleae]